MASFTEFKLALGIKGSDRDTEYALILKVLSRVYIQLTKYSYYECWKTALNYKFNMVQRCNSLIKIWLV